MGVLTRGAFTKRYWYGRPMKLPLVHDDLPSQEAADGYREGWAPILASLKTLLETGKPLPELHAFVGQGKPR